MLVRMDKKMKRQRLRYKTPADRIAAMGNAMQILAEKIRRKQVAEDKGRKVSKREIMRIKKEYRL